MSMFLLPSTDIKKECIVHRPGEIEIKVLSVLSWNQVMPKKKLDFYLSYILSLIANLNLQPLYFLPWSAVKDLISSRSILIVFKSFIVVIHRNLFTDNMAKTHVTLKRLVFISYVSISQVWLGFFSKFWVANYCQSAKFLCLNDTVGGGGGVGCIAQTT